MDEVTQDFREGVVKEMRLADDLVLVGDNWKEVESRYTRWKKALQDKGMKISVNKTKAFSTRRNFIRIQLNFESILALLWQKNGKDFYAVYKMSTPSAQLH